MCVCVCNARSKIIIVTKTKEQMSQKFRKTKRTLRLSQNYLGLKKCIFMRNFWRLHKNKNRTFPLSLQLY